jgi:hypothetical protein
VQESHHQQDLPTVPHDLLWDLQLLIDLCFVGILVDKDDLINYQLLIIYQLLIRTFAYQPTVDTLEDRRTINQLLILEGLLMIVDKVWKLTNTVRVGLDARSSHTQRQSTFPDNVCSYCPPCHGVLHYEKSTTVLFFWKFICYVIAEAFTKIVFSIVSTKRDALRDVSSICNTRIACVDLTGRV